MIHKLGLNFYNRFEGNIQIKDQTKVWISVLVLGKQCSKPFGNNKFSESHPSLLILAIVRTVKLPRLG